MIRRLPPRGSKTNCQAILEKYASHIRDVPQSSGSGIGKPLEHPSFDQKPLSEHPLVLYSKIAIFKEGEEKITLSCVIYPALKHLLGFTAPLGAVRTGYVSVSLAVIWH